MDSNRIETTAMSIWIEAGIIRLRAKGVVSTPQTVEETFSAIQDLLTEGPKPVLFDARDWPSPERAAWAPLIENISSVFTAGAILVGPSPPSGTSPFSTAVNQLVMPFAVFEDEDEAIAFLRSAAQDH